MDTKYDEGLSMYKQDLYKNIVVIGGNVSGLAAASQAKRVHPQAEVTVLEAGKYISYGTCGLPYYISGQIKELDALFTYPVDFFEKKRDIRILLNHRVTGVDTAAKQVLAENGKKISYDRLIICSGASPRKLNITHGEAKNVFHFWNIPDTLKLKEYLSAHKPQKALVAGAGSIGLLMAEAFSSLGIKVTMIELAARIFNDWEPEISDVVYKIMVLKGIQFLLPAIIDSFETNAQGMADKANVRKGADHVKVDTDMVLLSAGVVPNTDFLQATPVELDPSGAVKVSHSLQSSHINIFAAGDCALVKNLVSGKNEHIPTANNAAKTGRIAGSNAAGFNMHFKGSAQTKTDQFFGLEVARTGIGYAQASALGYDPLKVAGSFPSHVKAVGGSETITAALIVDAKSRRVLGAQMVGKGCVSKRIDIFAAALSAEMTADDVYMLDLSYAPKLSTVWDPVNKIAGKAVIALDRQKF